MTATATGGWVDFLAFARRRCSISAFENWLASIECLAENDAGVVLQVPNVFVQEYLLENYRQDLKAFLPLDGTGEAAVRFEVRVPEETASGSLTSPLTPTLPLLASHEGAASLASPHHFFPSYTFEQFIEGSSNQFVTAAAVAVAMRPGKAYNPLFIHGGVGLGKTHLLHAIGHYVQKHHRHLKVHCITTEGFINNLVDHLKNKSVDKLKKFYRSLDVLLIDDIQFLQQRLNFQEEFCATFEALIQQGKQVVITSDKPPSQLALSSRMVARMEWGLVAQVDVPEIETRVAILQRKAQQRGVVMSDALTFQLAQRLTKNVRQLEGAVNRLSAHSKMLGLPIDEILVSQILGEMVPPVCHRKQSVDEVLKAVAIIFEVRVPELKSSGRHKDIALARQVAMFLAKELIEDSVVTLAHAFGKNHSTLLHACKTIQKKLECDHQLRAKVDMVRNHLMREQQR